MMYVYDNDVYGDNMLMLQYKFYFMVMIILLNMYFGFKIKVRCYVSLKVMLCEVKHWSWFLMEYN